MMKRRIPKIVNNKNNSYEEEYPPIEEGEFVYVAPLQWTAENQQGRNLVYSKGIGQIITKGSVTYVVYMLLSKKIVTVSRQRMRSVHPDDWLDL